MRILQQQDERLSFRMVMIGFKYNIMLIRLRHVDYDNFTTAVYTTGCSPEYLQSLMQGR